jgi:hypothetical protein
MRLPIKLNEAGWPSRFSRLSFAFHDPRPLASAESSRLPPSAFSRAITTLQFGVTFKTTRPGRHKHSNRLISRLYEGLRPVVLDVGASDGSTSLDLIRELGDNLRHFFVTDLNLSTLCGHDRRGVLYFFDRDGTCVLRASKRFLVYSEMKGAHFPLTSIAKGLISGAGKVTDRREVLLIQPSLIELASRDPRITIERYDLFASWRGDRPDLIKVANLLNPKYFSDEQMREALRVQCANLGLGGRLLLVSEDDDREAFSVFRKSPTGMTLEYTHGEAKAAGQVPVALPLDSDGKRGQPGGHVMEEVD